MITKYIDCSLSGTSGSGSIGDPFSYLAFKGYAQTPSNFTDHHTFLFDSRGYEFPGDSVWLDLSDSGGYNIICKSKTNEPAVLKAGGTTAFQIYGSTGDVTLENLIFERSGGPSTYLDIEPYGKTITIKNCSIFDSVTGFHSEMFFLDGAVINIIGNTLITQNSTTIDQWFNIASTSAVLTFSSNYLEGKVSNILKFSGGINTATGNFRNNYSYNNSAFSNWLTGDSQSGVVSSGNVNNSGLVTQFSGYSGNYSGVHSTIIPSLGSPLIDGGYAESGWTTDIFGVTRVTPDVGSAEYQESPINSFDSPPARDSVPVVSSINATSLVAKTSSDPYFDNAAKIRRVDIYYRSPDGRQVKKLQHTGGSLTCSVYWTSGADAGVWEKYRVKCYDFDGALHELTRGDIGTSEDLTLA